MRGLVEVLVVIDAEGQPVWPTVAPAPATCGGKKRADTDDMTRIGGEVVEVGHVHVQGIAGNLGVVPVDGEGDGSVAEHAEVECVVGVLPDVFAAEDEVFAEGLLEAGMEFVADSRGLQVVETPECRRAAERGHSLAQP